jgi:hypothetical protein
LLGAVDGERRDVDVVELVAGSLGHVRDGTQRVSRRSWEDGRSLCVAIRALEERIAHGPAASSDQTDPPTTAPRASAYCLVVPDEWGVAS